MRVVVAESAGFCRGVKRAVEKARALAREHGGIIHTDGPLIHNQEMIRELEAERVVECGAPSSLTAGTLLIRAHGIPPERRAMLSRLPVHLADATCPDVARIQGLIRAHARRGFSILIYGDPGHAEVEGLLGYAEGRGYVLATPAEVASLPALERVCLVSQSTQFPFAFDQMAAAVRERFPSAVVLDTICESTRNRQAEVVRMAGEVDAFVVVGGSHSANTMRLVELARSLRPTIHIQTAAQLQPSALGTARVVGLTAGASTPSFIIDDVRATLERL